MTIALIIITAAIILGLVFAKMSMTWKKAIKDHYNKAPLKCGNPCTEYLRSIPEEEWNKAIERSKRDQQLAKEAYQEAKQQWNDYLESVKQNK